MLLVKKKKRRHRKTIVEILSVIKIGNVLPREIIERSSPRIL